MSIRASLSALASSLATFEPALHSPADCAELTTLFARAEHALSAARVRAAARAAECGEHRRRGFADATDWLAAASGATPRAARDELELARHLAHHGDTEAALVTGDVSLTQAAEIVRTAREMPGSEAALVELAKVSSLSKLRDETRKLLTNAVSAEELYARQRSARAVRHWRDELGMVCGSFRLTPEVGVPFVHRLDRATDRCRRDTRRADRPERWEAHGADAFTRLFAGSPDAPDAKSRGRSVDLVLVCDERAYRRGHAHPGEVCHSVDGGPLPVAVVRDLAHDAFVKLLLHDGVRIQAVRHVGRRRSAELETTLRLGPPPSFDGLQCCEPGCDRRYHLEIDHVDPVANRGPTSLENLQPRCWPHHRVKTERDRRAGLLGGRAASRPPPDG